MPANCTYVPEGNCTFEAIAAFAAATKAAMSPPATLAVTVCTRCAPSCSTWATGRLVYVGDFLERDEGARGRSKRQIANFHDIVSAVAIENADNVANLVASIGLSDDIPLIGGAD